MNIFERIKKIFTGENSKKNYTNLVTVLAIGIIALITASTFMESKNNKSTIIPFENDLKEPTKNKSVELINDYANELEDNLEEILCEINGVGAVKVMITLEDTAERIPAINTTKSEETTNETDSQGGVREIIKEDVTQQVVVSSSGENSLLVIKEVKPKVNGVIVVAKGAEDIQVKEQLYTAVKTVLGIPGNRVEIYSMKN